MPIERRKESTMDSVQQQIKIENLAHQVVIHSRNTLLVNLRFLSIALSQLVYVPANTTTLATDGKHIFYNSRYILSCYKHEKEIPVRDYLHIVIHCIFRHMYVGLSIDYDYWSLACDIAAENVITELNLNITAATREQQQAQYIAQLKTDVKQLTAEHIYCYFKQNNFDKAYLKSLKDLFFVDDHRIWYASKSISPDSKGRDKEANNKNSTEDNSDTSFSDTIRTANGDQTVAITKSLFSNADNEKNNTHCMMEKKWEKISKQIGSFFPAMG